MFEISPKTLAAAAKNLEMGAGSVCYPHRQALESPIEIMLLEALVAYHFCTTGTWPVIRSNRRDHNNVSTNWTITPQAQIDKFRVDFLLVDTHYGTRVVIECDGHDFHERTKEQARKDRSRDRDLQAKGYLVLRYTGSEIWANPWACVEDVQEKIWDLSRYGVDAA